MNKKLCLAIAVFSLVGCASVPEPVPADYKGPVASLADTGVSEDGSKAQLFVAIEMDGNRMNNSVWETRAASSGQGFSLTPQYITRNIPVRPMKLRLLGTHQTAAPIHEIASRIAGTFFSVEGVVDFSPVEGRQYEITGELKKGDSCVWIVEAETKAPASERVCTK